MSIYKIPHGAEYIIKALEQSGFEAYVVGGCVRDTLLSKTPKDWDICTSATPDEIKCCFERCIDTGLKHGTVSILMEDGVYEVTTFRKDGNYSDNRHPDSVEFVNDLGEDLARRDFTINAMAYSRDTGLIDIHNGLSDIQNKLINCVGNPNDRFTEDALRIMRAMRFASIYGYSIEKNTSDSIHKNKSKLSNISFERIQAELTRLLCGDGVLSILLEYSDVISEIIPELKPCIGFEQNNRYHQYTIYEHIAHAVSNYKGQDTSVKVALLLHDIGKPLTYSEDERGGHFYGHPEFSKDIAETVLSRLKFDNKTKSEVLELVLYHDAYIAPTPKSIKRWLNKIGDKRLKQLLCVKLADSEAHAEGTQDEWIALYHTLDGMIDEIISSEQCFKIKDLAINGYDLINLGIQQGKSIGDMLNKVLELVINGELPNDKDSLIKYISSMVDGGDSDKQRTETSIC